MPHTPELPMLGALKGWEFMPGAVLGGLGAPLPYPQPAPLLPLLGAERFGDGSAGWLLS